MKINALYLNVRRCIRPRYFLKRIKDHFLDICHAMANGGQSAIPPPTLRYVGDRDFHFVGSSNVRNIRKFCALDGKKVLEIGCGSGRNALAMTAFDVDYVGFDIHAPFISWCEKHVTRQFPNFRFRHADVQNGQYNPRGKISSGNYLFPFENESFDLVILTSVFTHMLENDVMHYFDEIARLLARGGKLYATFFLLNEVSNRMIEERRSNLFLHPYDGERVKVAAHHIPELAVGYDEALITDSLRKRGLDLKVSYGAWCGRSEYFDYQDVIFAEKNREKYYGYEPGLTLSLL